MLGFLLGLLCACGVYAVVVVIIGKRKKDKMKKQLKQFNEVSTEDIMKDLTKDKGE